MNGPWPSMFKAPGLGPGDRQFKSDRADQLTEGKNVDRIPDIIGTVRGWRAWGLMHPGFLTDINSRSIWEPGKRNEATCLTKAHSGVIPPVETCSCGFWVIKDIYTLVGLLNPSDTTWWPYLVGQVEGWGGVVPHANGWRVQYAYPQNIIIVMPGEACYKQTLQERYGVEVLFKQDFVTDILARVCRMKADRIAETQKMRFAMQLQKQRDREKEFREKQKLERQAFNEWKKQQQNAPNA